MRTTRALLLACALGAVAALATVAAAGAAYPHISVDPGSGPPGTTVTVTGTSFCSSCGPVEIDVVTTPVRQGIAVAADGSFRATFQVPGSAQAGTDAVNAYQQGNLVTQTDFTVSPSTAAPAPAGGPPPPSSAAPGGGPTPADASSGATATAAGGGAPTGPGSGSPGASAQPAAAAAGGARNAGSGGLSAGVLAVIIAGALVLATGGAVLARRWLG